MRGACRCPQSRSGRHRTCSDASRHDRGPGPTRQPRHERRSRRHEVDGRHSGSGPPGHFLGVAAGAGRSRSNWGTYRSHSRSFRVTARALAAVIPRPSSAAASKRPKGRGEYVTAIPVEITNSQSLGTHRHTSRASSAVLAGVRSAVGDLPGKTLSQIPVAPAGGDEREEGRRDHKVSHDVSLPVVLAVDLHT